MFQDFIDWMESHPFIVAIGIFAIFFVFYQYIKRGTATATATVAPTATPDITETGSPGPPGVSGPGGPQGVQGIQGIPGPPSTVVKPPPIPIFKPPPNTNTRWPRTPQPTSKYVTVQPWPAQLGSLWGIAQYAHKPLSQIEALNPQYSSNWNLIYAGQKVRIA